MSQIRLALHVAARVALRGWGCRKPTLRECPYDTVIQRNCARNLRISLTSLGAEPSWRGTAQGDANFLSTVTIRMGVVGGACATTALLLQRKLRNIIPIVSRHAHDIGNGRALYSATSAQRSPTLSAQTGPAPAQQDLTHLGRLGPVVNAPFCKAFCRRTNHLTCPAAGPTYDSAASAAAEAHTAQLGDGTSLVDGQGHRTANRSSLAVFTFVYAAHVDSEMRDTFEKWGPWSYGHGADAIVLGATWQSVMRTTALPAADSNQIGAPPLHRLEWSPGAAASWRDVLRACVRAASCSLLTPLDTPRQSARQPYLDFISLLRPIATDADVAVLDGFGATWDGVRTGLMVHHDSTRIHFSDTGRAFLAQLTLLALSALMVERD